MMNKNVDRILSSAKRNTNRDTDYEYLNLKYDQMEAILLILENNSKNILLNSDPDEDMYFFYYNTAGQLSCATEKKEITIFY